MLCSSSDIVLLPIPFTDLTSSKVRPAIVIGHGSFSGDLFVVPVTSQLANADFRLADWQTAGLNVASGREAFSVPSSHHGLTPRGARLSILDGELAHLKRRFHSAIRPLSPANRRWHARKLAMYPVTRRVSPPTRRWFLATLML